MATFKGTQRTKLTVAQRLRINSSDANDSRKIWFDFTVPASPVLAVNDLVELVEIPAGCRFLGGYIDSEAMSSGAGDASMQLGTAASATKFKGTTSVDAAAQFTFGVTKALGHGEVYAVKTLVIAKCITEAWLAGKTFQGWIEVLQGV